MMEITIVLTWWHALALQVLMTTVTWIAFGLTVKDRSIPAFALLRLITSLMWFLVWPYVIWTAFTSREKKA